MMTQVQYCMFQPTSAVAERCCCYRDVIILLLAGQYLDMFNSEPDHSGDKTDEELVEV